ncbi:MAG: translocation/assembly module TamB domain-containing protein, partial [Stenotrophobium sp.]
MSARFRLPLIGALPVLLLALAAAAWFVLCTESGLQAAVGLVQRYGGGHLGIAAAQGTLLGECLIEDVRYANAEGLRIGIGRVHMRLRAQDLLARRLHVELAEVSDVHLQLPPNPAPSAPLTSLPQQLPLGLVIDSFNLKNFSITRGKDELFRIDQANLSGSWIGNEVRITRLNAELPQTSPLSASGQARMSADHVDITELTLKGPGELSLNGHYGLGEIASDLNLNWKSLRWPLQAEDDALLVSNATGAAHLTGTLAHYQLQLQSDAAVHKLPVKITARGDGSLDDLHLDSLSLNTDKGALRAQGRLAWSPALSADLQMQIEQLNPALFAADWSGELNGSITAHTMSRKSGPDVAFSTRLDHSTLRGYPLALSADGSTDTRSVQLTQFLLRSGKGSLSGSGAVAWEPALRADLKAQISNFDPGPFVPLIIGDHQTGAATRWRGIINGSISVQTTTRAGRRAITFAVNVDQSQLRGHPLKLATQGELLAETLNLQDFALTSGGTRLTASGQATPPFDLAGRLDSPNLADLAPGLEGRANLGFKLQGPLAYPHLVTSGQGSALRYRNYSAARLDWDGDLDPRQPSRLTVELSDARAGLHIHSAKLSASGIEVYQHVQLDASTERGDLSVTLDGGYDRRRNEWGGHLSALRLAPVDLPPWTLEQSAGLLLGTHRLSLEPACLSGNGGRACLRVEQNVTRQGLRLTWNLDRLLLAAFKPLLPPHYQVEGEATGAGALEFANGDVTALNAMLNLGRASISAPDMPPVEILPSSLKLDDLGGHLHALLNLRVAQGTLDADISAAPGADFDARALSGSVQLNVPDLAFVGPLTTALANTGGNITGAFKLGGSIGLPRLSGQLALSGGRAKLPLPGISLEDVQLRLSGDGSGPLALDGSMKSGGGSLSLSGTVDPSASPLRADLNIKGDEFQAMATPDARIWATPGLHLLSGADGIHLDGTLDVPRADITPQGLGDNGISASKDQVIVGAEPQPASTPLNVYSQLQITLGDAVHVEGFGLTTRVTGGVSLTDEPQRETRAQG